MAHNSWEGLPSIIIVEILSYLCLNDRINASSTCSSWRSCLFHPALWRKIRFKFKYGNREGARFLHNTCARFVREVVLEFNSRSFANVADCMNVLETLVKNPNVEKLTLKPSSFDVAWPSVDTVLYYDYIEEQDNLMTQFVDALCEIIKHSRNLQHFTLGCIPELNDFVEPLLRLLAIHQANSMQSLHLAGVKADPEFYQLAQISPHCFHSLRNLQVLSIDHDYVSDEMLKPFLSSTPQKRAPLKSLIMHVHGKEVPRNTVSNVTWQEMMKYNPQLEVTLTLIHSVDGMNKLLDILKPAMPLTHLHMLFCYEMNISAIVFIQRHLWRQLKTFYVVEGMVDNIPMVYEDIEATNPFVMLAWKCINLQQFTFIGYNINVPDLIAIARLRGKQLKRLDVPLSCIGALDPEEDGPEMNPHFIEEISECLGHPWRPLPESALANAVRDPDADAEEQYIDLLLKSQEY